MIKWLRRQIGVNPAKVMEDIGDDFIAKEIDNMGYASSKVHVIADETLGGTLREYVETNRKAEVGEKVYVEVQVPGATGVRTVERVLDDGHVFYGEYGRYYGGYRTLEPTDIVHIEGKRYKLVDRKAEVGEQILVAKKKRHNMRDMTVGKAYEVISGPFEGGDEDYVEVIDDEGDQASAIDGSYYVLDPIESEKEVTSPQSTDDIIANLIKRVAELERENKAMLVVYERDQKWTHARINGVKDDIETWAQEHEKTKRELDDKIEMCIDDIVTLDERTNTQVTLSVADLAKLIGGDR